MSLNYKKSLGSCFGIPYTMGQLVKINEMV